MRNGHLLLGAGIFLAGCGGGDGDGGTQPPPPPPPQLLCQAPASVALSPGQHAVFDPAASGGCIRFPTPSGEAEYLLAVTSTTGLVMEGGVFGPYLVKAAPVPATSPPVPASSVQFVEPTPVRRDLDGAFAARFDAQLRERERGLAADPANRMPPRLGARAPAPPVVGEQRSFSVCQNFTCTAFDTVAAVARYVGSAAVIYLDTTVPTQDSLTTADLNDLGRTFDVFHHPIDTTAFGAESDIDGNGLVAILLTDAVNALTTDCADGRILGFFFGGDLLTIAGSNRAEIFYGMVPAPATGNCTAAARQQTVDRLKPTLIHELQHMISFNQHALVRGGPGEVTWLNEAMSHFAEELGGRLIPSSECVRFSSCRSQYISADLFNAFDYLLETEKHFLVSPRSSSGTLEERGAGWLFVRWLADQFGTDSLGTNITRAMEQTAMQGAANVSAATGAAFSQVVPEWFLATFVDDLAGFVPASPRMAYTSWGFRSIFLANCCFPNAPFTVAFPTDPPAIFGSFTWTGTLKGGSGRHFRVVRSAGAAPLDVQLLRTSVGDAIDPALAARIGVVRVK